MNLNIFQCFWRVRQHIILIFTEIIIYLGIDIKRVSTSGIIGIKIERYTSKGRSLLPPWFKGESNDLHKVGIRKSLRGKEWKGFWRISRCFLCEVKQKRLCIYNHQHRLMEPLWAYSTQSKHLAGWTVRKGLVKEGHLFLEII